MRQRSICFPHFPVRWQAERINAQINPDLMYTLYLNRAIEALQEDNQSASDFRPLPGPGILTTCGFSV